MKSFTEHTKSINEAQYISATNLINDIVTFELRKKTKNRKLVCFLNDEIDTKEGVKIEKVVLFDTLEITYYIDGKSAGYDYKKV